VPRRFRDAATLEAGCRGCLSFGIAVTSGSLKYWRLATADERPGRLQTSLWFGCYGELTLIGPRDELKKEIL
jgi:hypothetical protein